MNILMMGPPGVGKGTQAGQLSRQLNIPHISTGDMLRSQVQQKTELGLAAAAKMEAGDLVPDNLIIAMMKNRVQEPDCQNGIILDGFPRTHEQALALKQTDIKINYVFDIDCDDELIVARLAGRLFHPQSGRVYHVTSNPPKVAGKDDETGEPLITRPDDQKSTVINRLAVYRQLTAPLKSFYHDENREGELTYTAIRGDQDIPIIQDAILKILGQ